MWMAVYLVSVLDFKLGIELMRLNLLVVDSQHIHTSQDIYEMMIFFIKLHFKISFLCHISWVLQHLFFSPRVRAGSSRMKPNDNLVLGPLPGARR